MKPIPFRLRYRTIAVRIDFFKRRRSHRTARSHARARTLRASRTLLPIALPHWTIVRAFAMGTRGVAFARTMSGVRTLGSSRTRPPLELPVLRRRSLRSAKSTRSAPALELTRGRRGVFKLARTRRRWRRPRRYGLVRGRSLGWLGLRRAGGHFREGQDRQAGHHPAKYSVFRHVSTLLNPVGVRCIVLDSTWIVPDDVNGTPTVFMTKP